MAELSDAQLEKETERWFARRGLPMFIENYSAAEDIFTRAYPVLVLLFLLNLVGVLGVELAGWAGVVVLVLGFVSLVVVSVLAARAGRPRVLQQRTRVGGLETVLFVVVPPVVALVVDGVQAAMVALALTTVQLLVIYVVTRYALFAALRWAIGQVVGQLGDVSRLVTRALPLLLLFITFLFINTEVWQVAGSLEAGELWLAIGFFAGIAIIFLVARLPEELAHVEAEATRDFVLDSVASTPLAVRAQTLPDLTERQPLTRSQQRNVMLVLLFTQLVQAALLAVAVWVFFMAFGAVAILLPVQAQWMGGDPDVILRIATDHAITRELFRVSTFIGGFAGLYFTVYAVTDATYRSQFFGHLVDEIGRVVGVRRAYLSLRRQRPQTAEAAAITR